MPGYPQPYIPSLGAIFPPDLSDNLNIFPRLNGLQFFHRKTEWNTTNLRAKSGRRFKTQNWTYPIRHFTATFNSLNQAADQVERDRLEEFFDARQGGYGTFYVWDDTQHTASNQVVGTGDGTTTLFQLVRRVRTYIEPIFATVTPPEIFVDGGQTNAFTVVGPGVIQFNSAPSAGQRITWSGEYMFWCEFEQDILDMDQLDAFIFANATLSMQTVKL